MQTKSVNWFADQFLKELKLKPKNLTLSLPAIIIWNTKAREINDSIVFSIDYYSTLKETV